MVSYRNRPEGLPRHIAEGVSGAHWADLVFVLDSRPIHIESGSFLTSRVGNLKRAFFGHLSIGCDVLAAGLVPCDFNLQILFIIIQPWLVRASSYRVCLCFYFGQSLCAPLQQLLLLLFLKDALVANHSFYDLVDIPVRLRRALPMSCYIGANAGNFFEG